MLCPRDGTAAMRWYKYYIFILSVGIVYTLDSRMEGGGEHAFEISERCLTAREGGASKRRLRRDG